MERITQGSEPELGVFKVGLARQRAGWDWAEFMTLWVIAHRSENLKVSFDE